MTGETYDAVIVGARCAGASTAMLLARQGHRVLVVDRAAFPSDTLSTHLIHPPGLAALRRWGLLDRVVATGCPEITTYTFDLGPLVISGSPAGLGFQGSYAPRRTVLDKILVDAAVEAGAEVREKFTVEGLVTEGDAVTGIRGHGPDGAATTEYGRVVIGADGAHSMVARAVDAPATRRSRSSRSATTRTGRTCRCTAGSRRTCGATAPSRPGPPTKT